MPVIEIFLASSHVVNVIGKRWILSERSRLQGSMKEHLFASLKTFWKTNTVLEHVTCLPLVILPGKRANAVPWRPAAGMRPGSDA